MRDGKNSGKKKIYCVAIGKYRKEAKLVEFLEELARSNSGKFLGFSDKICAFPVKIQPHTEAP